MNSNKLFCSYCGSELLENFVFECFSISTGKKLYRKECTCPNRTWWNWFLHDHRTVSIPGSYTRINLLFNEENVEKFRRTHNEQ